MNTESSAHVKRVRHGGPLTDRPDGRGWYDYGGHGPTVVLLHGFLGSGRYWDRLAPLLAADGFRVVAVDLLGFGAAPKPRDSAYGYKEHVKHVEMMLRRHGIPDDIPLIMAGHSMGALIAKRFALTYPARVSRLVLMHPPLYDGPEQARSTLRRTGRTYRFLLDSRYRNLLWPALRLMAAGKLRHQRWSREGSLVNVIERAEAFTDLARLNQPALLIVGTSDRPEYQRNLAAHNLPTNVRLELIASGHHSPRRQATQLSRLITGFLKSSKTV